MEQTSKCSGRNRDFHSRECLSLNIYAPCRFDIPIPTFQELFQEHLIAPFFVFQIFCVALWFLDEMWYYSLFTLFMLFVFESTVVMQVRRHEPFIGLRVRLNIS